MLLCRWIELSQQQLALSDLVGLDPLLFEKDGLILELQKLDELMMGWGKEQQRLPKRKEIKAIRHAQNYLAQIEIAENEFARRLADERRELSREIGLLHNQTSYLKPGASKAGQLFNMRKKSTY